jgi:hypothetical protein
MATAGQKRFASLDKDEMDEIMKNLDAKNTKSTQRLKFSGSTRLKKICRWNSKY